MLVLCFSLISEILEVIFYLFSYNIVTFQTFIYSILSKITFAIILMVALLKIKHALFIKKIPNLLFMVYDDKIINNSILYENLYYFLIALLKFKDDYNSNTQLIDCILNHIDKCKNEICKCKLINLIPLRSLSFKKKEFIACLLKRIGFCIETSIIKLDYTSNYYITVILAEYFYLFKQNPLMSFSILDTYYNSYHNHPISTSKNILLCFLFNRYASKCIESLDNSPMCNLYHSLILDQTITKSMEEYTDIFEKGIINKENFENGTKCSYHTDTTDIKSIRSHFLTSKNINDIMSLLGQQNKIYKKISRTISSFIMPLGIEMSIDFYLKNIFYFYLFNNGHLPTEILYFNTSNNWDNVNMFMRYSKAITFFNESTVLADMEDLLDDFYSQKNVSNNLILKCVKGFKIEYISGDLPSKLGYNKDENCNLIGENFDNIVP